MTITQIINEWENRIHDMKMHCMDDETYYEHLNNFINSIIPIVKNKKFSTSNEWKLFSNDLIQEISNSNNVDLKKNLINLKMIDLNNDFEIIF